MRCAACDAALDLTNVFPGGAMTCGSCGVENRLPLPLHLSEQAPSPYRTAESRPSLEAPSIPCPFCGGRILAEARTCPHCTVKLDAVRCAHCFALQMTGMRTCERCGKELELEPLLDPTDAPCPRCEKPLDVVPGGEAGMHECAGCGGLFVDHRTLAQITLDRERSGPLASSRPFEISRPRNVDTDVRYVKCPLCHQLMNRANFGRKSGVIVDVCKMHGTWFDAGELTLAVTFVANGGMAGTRRRDKEDAEQAAREKSTAAFTAQALAANRGSDDDNSGALGLEMTTALAEILIRALFG